MLSVGRRACKPKKLRRVTLTRTMVPVPAKPVMTGADGTDLPLTPKEVYRYRYIMEILHKNEPDICRELIAHEQAAAANLTHKATTVKIQRQYGRGKTQFFAYLATTDKERILELTQAKGVEEIISNGKNRTRFFANLPSEVKYNAIRNWQKEREGRKLFESSTKPPPSELAKYALCQGAPMVGFGFVDNFFMISIGGTIDVTFGIYFSTMMAAGLGNLCSNILGLGIADHIEAASGRMGIPAPKLSERQREMTSVRVSGFAGIITGVTIGCLLGLIPCLFIEDKADKATVTNDAEPSANT